MDIAFYGSSLLSSYWNGAATYYRGILSALAPLGHRITFYEPDAFERQQHRDIEPPEYARVVVYEATEAGLRGVLAEAGAADVVVKASGVGVFDDALLTGVVAQARPGALRLFWDVDAAATLEEVRADAGHPMRALLPPARRRADLWRRATRRGRLHGAGRPHVRAHLQRARPGHPPPGPVRAALRLGPRLPCQPAAGPGAAGGAVLPRCRRAVPGAAVPAGRQRLA